MNNVNAVIAALENAPAIVLPLVREVPSRILTRRPKPDKWSAHEHACHLAVVHPMFFVRLDLMLNNPMATITPYNPEMDEEEGSLLKLDLDESMKKFSQDRLRLVGRLKRLSDADWQRTAAHGEYNHYSVFIMFRHLALHDLFHSYRIEELLLKKEW